MRPKGAFSCTSNINIVIVYLNKFILMLMLTDRVQTELELLERHIIILACVIQKGPIGIIKLSEEVNIPSHKVRYSLRVLEQERLIIPSTQGAIATDDAKHLIKHIDSTIDSLREKIDNIDKT